MFGSIELDETAKQLVEGAEKARDIELPEVRAATNALGEALTAWRKVGAKLPDCEGVLTAANDLLDALHEANPEGLPFGVRDPATEMLTLVDLAEENGFRVRPTSPAP